MVDVSKIRTKWIWVLRDIFYRTKKIFAKTVCIRLVHLVLREVCSVLAVLN